MAEIPKTDDDVSLESHRYSIYGPYYTVNLHGIKCDGGAEITFSYRHKDRDHSGKIFIPDDIVEHIFIVLRSPKICSLTFTLTTIFETLTIQQESNTIILIHENRIGPKVETETIVINQPNFLRDLLRDLYPKPRFPNEL